MARQRKGRAMRLDIDITGLKQVQDVLSGFSDRRLAAAGATALTRVARDLADQWRSHLEEHIDRPTRATVQAVQWLKADAATMVAEVKIKDTGSSTPPTQWLLPQELGGRRQVKKFERALQAQGSMPGGWNAVPGPAAKLDAFGNVARSQIVQVIAQLGAKYSPGYQRVISKSAAKRSATAVANGRAYVAILPGNKGRATPGVYERSGRGLRAVFYYVRATQYSKAIDLLGEARRMVPGALSRELQRSIEESAARLAARGKA